MIRKTGAVMLAVCLALEPATAAFAEEAAQEESEVVYEVEEGAVFLDDSGEYSYRERALDLVSRMTLEEKASQMTHSMAAIPRLGVEAYNVWSEALHGVHSVNCTSYPISIAMGSSWNKELVEEVATAISYEGRAYYNIATGGDFIGGGLTFWSPVVEPARDPRWGRTAESYSEDTYLTTELAGAFITGMMGDDENYYRTVPTAKHFIANNVEDTRMITSSKLEETDLYEYYIKAYRSLILDYDLPSIMTSYNRVNDVPSSTSVTLVDTLVRKKWGMNGYVTGDCGAVGNISRMFNYVGDKYADEEESNSAIGAALSLIAGVDSNCLGDSSAYVDAVNNGYISEEELDEAAVNMYTIRFSLGEFDESTPWDDLGEELIENDEELELSKKAAEETIVLLENSGILPLDVNSLEGKKVAVIGPFADTVELGQYSSSPTKLISPLQAIQTYLEEAGVNCDVEYFNGGTSFTNDVLFKMTGFTLIMEDGTEVAYDVADYDPEASTEGLTVSRAGMEDTKSVIPVYDGMEIVFPYVEFEGAKAIRIEGASDGCAVEITSQGTKTLGYYEFTESVGKDAGYGGISGGTEDLELMTGGQTNADMTFKFTSVPLDFSAEAAEIAADADVTLLFVGADTNTATESNDRDTLDLPGTQDELIAAVTDASDQVVVSVMSMNMVEAEDFKDKAEALLWYGFNGQVQGTAIIETLFGDANPSGHLPFTWYKSVNDLPNINDYSLTSAAENSDSTGRTYMYYDGEISYPFGYGLSYTTFEISNLTIDQDTFTPNDTLTFTVDVTNTGDVAGKEVVQLYYSAPDAAEADRPNKQLIGFDKVELEPSETKTVTMTVKAADLWYYEDEDGDSLNQEETPQGDGTLNTSPDLVINGNIAYLNGDYVFEAATAASNMDNTGAAEDSLTVSATMDGALELQLQNVTIETGTVDSGKPQFLETGDTVQTVTSVALNNDTFLDLSEAEVTYSSNREDVVTVDSDGLITAQGTGVATITATVTYNGSTLTSECAVKVM